MGCWEVKRNFCFSVFWFLQREYHENFWHAFHQKTFLKQARALTCSKSFLMEYVPKFFVVKIFMTLGYFKKRNFWSMRKFWYEQKSIKISCLIVTKNILEVTFWCFIDSGFHNFWKSKIERGRYHNFSRKFWYHSTEKFRMDILRCFAKLDRLKKAANASEKLFREVLIQRELMNLQKRQRITGLVGYFYILWNRRLKKWGT